MTPALLLDTCAVLWIVSGDGIAPEAEDEINARATDPAGLRVSPITAWELGLLAARGRLAAAMAPAAIFRAILDLPGVRMAEMPPEVLLDSSTLPGAPPNDPADRIVIATARAQGLRVMTRDRRILSYADAGFVQAVPC
ncbi:MAG: type II toxin-antitoxin system VapC family toxin [Pseudomonadota bacterium]|nr:type II toxin-antitoxin system VapC family toxin [Pseudomonadota bacterium]MEE3099203.1 type II toxin-antitoxin system VapC family toxin [Pseudomonadota bacterium]